MIEAGANAQREMLNADFGLAIPQDGRRTLALAWLGLGLAALLASGLFSILLVLSRTPQLQQLFSAVSYTHLTLPTKRIV